MKQQSNKFLKEKKYNHSIKSDEGYLGLRIPKSLLKEKFKALNQKRSPSKNTPKLRLCLFKNEKKRLGGQFFSPNYKNYEKYSLKKLEKLQKNKINTSSSQKQQNSIQLQENILEREIPAQKTKKNTNKKINEKQQKRIENKQKQLYQKEMMRKNIKMIKKNDLSSNILKYGLGQLKKQTQKDIDFSQMIKNYGQKINRKRIKGQINQLIKAVKFLRYKSTG